MKTIRTTWSEDATNTLMGRLTAISGSGADTDIPGEGSWLEQADFSSITRTVYDLDAADPETPVDTAALAIATVIKDTPQTAGWTADEVGYNLLDNIPADVFSTGGHSYRAEYLATLVDGSVFTFSAVGPCVDLIQS